MPLNRVLGIQSPLRVMIKRSQAMRNSAFLLQNATRSVGFGSEPEINVPQTEDTKPYYVSILVRSFNEGRFILEWLAHHKAIGIDHVFIYDNGSDDDTAELLAEAERSGFVTRIYWPDKPITPGAEIDYFNRFAQLSEWTAYIDTDEFIKVRSDESLKEILEHTKAPALAMNWRLYGSGNLEEPEADNMLGSLVRSEPQLHYHIKVIAKNDEIIRYRNSHNFYYRGGRLARTAEGRPAYGTFVDPARESKVELSHYVCRGAEDTLKKHASKVSVEGDPYQREVVFDHSVYNEIENRLPEEHLRKVAAALDELKGSYAKV